MPNNVLVVEDDMDARNALCAMLEGLGYSYVAYATAKEALANVANQEIKLALLDVMMPEMNGYELLKELRLRPEFGNLPVIMVTARDDESDVLQGYQHGADYYITKPYSLEQLRYGLGLYLQPQ